MFFRQLLAFVFLVASTSRACSAEAERCELLVYGATPGGIAAALAAADDGSQVILIEPTSRIGGLITCGLSHTDFHSFEGLTGSYLQFAQLIERHYRQIYGEGSQQVRDSFRGTFAEPQVNLKIFSDLIAERPRIRLLTSHRLDTVQIKRSGTLTHLESVSFLDHKMKTVTFRPEMVIDGTYEGDLMAKAGVPWRTGREGRKEYDEPLAPETADQQLQAYNFRFIMTKSPANRLPPQAPEGYRRNDFLPVLAILRSGKIKKIFDYPSGCLFKAQTPPLPNGKYDINDVSRGLVRLSLPGQNLDWPNGDERTRQRIFKEHLRDQLGLLYFLQTDDDVPARFRDEAREWGMCRDEFKDTNGLPPQLYVREARRMIGLRIFTEHDSSAATDDARAILHMDSIASGEYGNNCHGTAHEGERFGGKHTGEFYKPVPPYQIPYGTIVPKSCSNLLVPVAVSATHVGFCALRLEPIWMSLGQAAGHAAHQARTSKKLVQSIDVPRLQERLHTAGSATIYFSDAPPDHVMFREAQWWGTVGGFHGRAPKNAKPGQRGKNLHGQYFEAYPHHAADLDRVLDPELATRWIKLAGSLKIETDRLPAADGSITHGTWIAAAYAKRGTVDRK